MKRKDYKNYKWYPVTDETYWAEEYCDEFPNCKTIVRDTIDSVVVFKKR